MTQQHTKAIVISPFWATILATILGSVAIPVWNSYAAYSSLQKDTLTTQSELTELKKDIKDSKLAERMTALEVRMEGQKDATVELKKSVDKLGNIIAENHYGNTNP